MLAVGQIELSSPFGYSEEFASNFSSTTSSCGKTGYTFTTPTSYALNATTPTPTPTGVPTSPSCPDSYTVQAGDTCNSISLAHNVSTFAMLYWNGLNANCVDFPSAGSSICLPSQCAIYTIRENDTCVEIVKNNAPDISIRQLQSWNMNLNTLCTNLDTMLGDQICIR